MLEEKPMCLPLLSTLQPWGLQPGTLLQHLIQQKGGHTGWHGANGIAEPVATVGLPAEVGPRAQKTRTCKSRGIAPKCVLRKGAAFMLHLLARTALACGTESLAEESTASKTEVSICIISRSAGIIIHSIIS